MTTSSSPVDVRLVALHQRVTLGLWAVLVGVLPWLWRPGLITPDTKLDLLIDPWGYLGRALVAWDGRAGFGQLQNQAHGYLFPMGPFFGVGHSLDVPEWAIQRAWWSLVLVVGFLGAERALRALGVGAGLSTALPALAYALSPRVLTVLSDISVEAWPAAVCPWLVVVLVPALKRGADARTRVTMAVATGLLVTATGGVNAAASLLVLLVPGMLLVTAPSEVPRTRVAAWWLLGVLLGAVWWLAPLVVLGFYAFPFLEFIETASVTTSVTSVPQVFRGTSHWLAYIVGPDGRADWQAGWSVAQNPLAVVATSLLAGLGVAGLVRRRRRGEAGAHGAPDSLHVQRFALSTLLLGVLVMAAGYAGRYGGGVSSEVQQLLDGALAAFRNVHKADPLVRFPLAVGLGWVLQAAPGYIAGWTWPLLAEDRRAEVWRRWVTGVVAAALAVTVLPVWQGRVLAVGSFDQIPGYWAAAAGFVDAGAEREGGSTLLLPASRSGIYSWGRTDDEPLAALATSPVVVRDAVMLGAPEVSRILDVVDLMASTGARQDGLAAVLARLGVARVVVRHDLGWQVLAEDAALVERTLDRSPGFEPVERFGPRSSGLTVWNVEDAVAPVAAYPAEAIVRVAGGPEAMASLAQRGEDRDERAFVVGDDALPSAGTATVEHVSTDTLRVRRLNTGRVTRDAYSQTLDARAAANDRGRDLPPAGQGDPETVRVWEGVSSVRASDEASDPFTLGYRGPQYGSFAAVDGDPSTSWLASRGAASAWLELEFPDGVPTGPLRLDLATGVGVGESARVEVTAGTLDLDREVSSRRLVLPLDEANGSTLRITLHRRAVSSAGLPIGLTEVSIADRPVRTSLLAAHPPSAGPTTYVLVRDPRHRLDPSRAGEDGRSIERIVTADTPQRLHAEVRVAALSGEALERELDSPWIVTGSSRVGAGPSDRPGAALDGRPRTQWRAEVADLVPRLRLTARTPQSISSLRLSGGDRRRIVAVDLETSAGVVRLGNRGGEFPPLRTREVTLVFRLRDSDGVFESPEIRLDPVRRPTRVRLTCGEAGFLEVADRSVGLRLTTSRSALLEGRPMTAGLCDRSALRLPAGRSTVSVDPGDIVQGHSVLLAGVETDAAATAVSLPDPAVRSWAGNRRSFEVEPHPQGQVVAFAEGFNRGWQAKVGGRVLEPVRVDGWRQAFLVPAGTGGRVEAEFRPGRWYSAGLLTGALLVVLLVGCAAVLWRRPRDVPSAVPAAELRPEGARWARLVAAGGVAGLLFVVGGSAGLVVALVTGLLLVVRDRSVVLGPVLLATSGLVVVVSRLLERPSLGSGIAQVMTLATVSFLGWRLVLPRPTDDSLLDEEPREGRHEDAPERRDHEDRPEAP